MKSAKKKVMTAEYKLLMLQMWPAKGKKKDFIVSIKLMIIAKSEWREAWKGKFLLSIHDTFVEWLKSHNETMSVRTVKILRLNLNEYRDHLFSIIHTKNLCLAKFWIRFALSSSYYGTTDSLLVPYDPLLRDLTISSYVEFNQFCNDRKRHRKWKLLFSRSWQSWAFSLICLGSMQGFNAFFIFTRQ